MVQKADGRGYVDGCRELKGRGYVDGCRLLVGMANWIRAESGEISRCLVGVAKLTAVETWWVWLSGWLRRTKGGANFFSSKSVHTRNLPLQTLCSFIFLPKNYKVQNKF